MECVHNVLCTAYLYYFFFVFLQFLPTNHPMGPRPTALKQAQSWVLAPISVLPQNYEYTYVKLDKGTYMGVGTYSICME